MITKITDTPEIWQIFVPLPDSPLKNLNCYVLRTPEEDLIIDTGFRRPECESALWDGLRELGVDLGRASLFLTHLHSDHTGLAPQLASRGCRVYMNGIDYDYLTRTKSAHGRTWSSTLSPRAFRRRTSRCRQETTTGGFMSRRRCFPLRA